MAYLLGSEYCISSLKQDVKDLHQTLAEIESRTGQIKYQSWKFPDKMSCEVNVEEMLVDNVYNAEDDEESQVSHIMLYDLVIDRLVYLLQSLTSYNEALLNTKENTLTPKENENVRMRKSMSIGLTAKRCWSRMSQTAVALQKVAKEATRAYYDTNSTEENLASRKPTIAKQTPHIIHELDISKSMSSIACQTIDTALDNCETCNRAQQCLYKVGEEIIKTCVAHSLPTSLQDWKSRFDESNCMSIADLSRWSNYQTKDLSRISRHVNDIANQVKPLTKEVEDLQKTVRKLNKEIEQKNEVVDRHKKELMNDFRKREYLLKESEKKLSKQLNTNEKERMNLEEEVETNRSKISHLKDDILQKQDYIIQIENEHHRLKQESMEGQQYKKDDKKLSQKNHELTNILQTSEHNSKIAESKISSLQNREKSLVKKQQLLLLRLGNISEETENLRTQLAEAEEERDVALDKLQNNSLIDENNAFQMKGKYEVLESENEKLKQQIHEVTNEMDKYETLVEEYKNNERLLVCFPDLNQNHITVPDSGNVVEDMQNQIQANEVRINTLCAENNKLKIALKSISRSDETYETKPHKPVQLWQSNHDESYMESPKLDHSFSTSSGWSDNQLIDYTERFNRPPSSTRKQTAMNIPRHGSSAIDVYKTSKANSPQRRSFTVGSGKRPAKHGIGRRPVSAKSDLYKPWT